MWDARMLQPTSRNHNCSDKLTECSRVGPRLLFIIQQVIHPARYVRENICAKSSKYEFISKQQPTPRQPDQPSIPSASAEQQLYNSRVGNPQRNLACLYETNEVYMWQIWAIYGLPNHIWQIWAVYGKYGPHMDNFVAGPIIAKLLPRIDLGCFLCEPLFLKLSIFFFLN